MHIWLYDGSKRYSLLVFPSALVLVEFLLATFSPYSSWGAMIYAQPYALEMNQLASITGIYGISFIIGLTASITSWTIYQHLQNYRTFKPLTVLIVLLSPIWAFGSLRLKYDD